MQVSYTYTEDDKTKTSTLNEKTIHFNKGLNIHAYGAILIHRSTWKIMTNVLQLIRLNNLWIDFSFTKSQEKM